MVLDPDQFCPARGHLATFADMAVTGQMEAGVLLTSCDAQNSPSLVEPIIRPKMPTVLLLRNSDGCFFPFSKWVPTPQGLSPISVMGWRDRGALGPATG